jgi:hypothetical protein
VKKRRELDSVAGKGPTGIGLAQPRGTGAPDMILPRRGWHGSTGSFIGLAPASVRFWGRRCGLVFGPKPKFHASRVLGGVLGPSVDPHPPLPKRRSTQVFFGPFGGRHRQFLYGDSGFPAAPLKRHPKSLTPPFYCRFGPNF